jgi:peptide chain release factor subunit 1
MMFSRLERSDVVKQGTEGSGELPAYNEFVAALEKLESETGSGPELITLYIPPDKRIRDVIGHLKEEYSKTDLIGERKTRNNVQIAISSVLSHLKNYDHLPPRGIAIFCGKNRMAGNGNDLPCTIIEPIEPLNIYLYRCSSMYDLEPLKQMLEVRNVYGLLVLDLREAHWGFLRGNRIEPVGGITSSVPGKQRKGGQSAPRFQRLREIAVNEFFTRVGEHASSTFLAERDFFKKFKGVLIGGRSPTGESFLEGNYLHHEIQQRVVGVFEVACTDREGFSELVEKAHEIIEGMDIEKQKVHMDRFYEELEKGSSLAVYGEETIRKNLATGAIGTLLLAASLRKKRLQITCQDCGHSEERTFLLEPGTSVKEILTHTCRVCSSPIIESGDIDIIEELTRLADRTHAKTVIISDNFEAGSTFSSTYGGIGAILRYRTED